MIERLKKMSYYDDKKKAYSIIKQLSVNQNENIEDIENHIFQTFGFGKKIVEDILKILVQKKELKPKKFECAKCGNLHNILTGKPLLCSCGNDEFTLLEE
jgi:hypothetical protein